MNKFGLIGIFVAFFCCFSCNSDYTILDPIESISLVADKSVKTVGETITFTVNTNSGTNITEEAIIFVNGIAITGNTFTTTEIGNYTVSADYLGVQSSTLSIRFHDGSETNFVKRVLIEDYTGTWCGNCTRVLNAIELVKAQTENTVLVGIHRSSSNPADANYDPYNFDMSPFESTLINMTGYPKALLNRLTRWAPLEQNNIPQVINLTQGENPKLGFAMNAQVSGSTINLDVNVKFSKDFSNLKLVVYILENGLIYDQENYNVNLYGGVNPIPNFQHDHVLRACITNLFGDEINGNTTTGQMFTRSFSIPVPANIANSNNIEFVAFVTDENNKAINSRKANPGENQDFEEL
jgi:hypothetical protein